MGWIDTDCSWHVHCLHIDGRDLHMARRSLTMADREFLDLVSRAVFTNPFSDERVAVDVEISGLSSDVDGGLRLEAALDRVRSFLDGLVRAG